MGLGYLIFSKKNLKLMFRLKDDSDEEKFEDKVYIPGEKLEEGQQLEVNISS